MPRGATIRVAFHQSTHILRKHLGPLIWKKLIYFTAKGVRFSKIQLDRNFQKMSDLFHWLLFWKAWMKSHHPSSAHPLQMACSQADLHFRASGPRMDQVAQFTAATTLRDLPSPPPPSSLRLRSDYTLDVIFPVTLTSTVIDVAKKLSQRGRRTDRNLHWCVWTVQAQKNTTKPHQMETRSYLWVFLRRRLWPRFCPLNRAGGHRTRTPSTCSWSDACVLWVKVRD